MTSPGTLAHGIRDEMGSYENQLRLIFGSQKLIAVTATYDCPRAFGIPSIIRLWNLGLDQYSHECDDAYAGCRSSFEIQSPNKGFVDAATGVGVAAERVEIVVQVQAPIERALANEQSY